MCIIVYKPKDCYITKRTFKACFKANPDGFGFMFAYKNKLHIQKGFMAQKAAYKAYRSFESQYPNSDFVLHFRINSSGKTCQENCHPFRIGNIGFAHNGVLAAVNVPANSTLSDTMIFCRDVLAHLPKNWYRQDAYLHLIETYAQANVSKFIIMDNMGLVKIFNEKAGIWDNGLWFSNVYYNAVSTYGFASRFDGDYDYTKKDIVITNDIFYECLVCNTYFSEDDLLLSNNLNEKLCPYCRSPLLVS